MNMKTLTTVALTLLTATLLAAPLGGSAAEAKPAKAKPYPLDTCVVSGEKLGGDMGEPYVFTHEGREIKLCCKSCKKDFDKTPAKFVAKVDEAAKKVKPYKLDTCIVSGEKLGDDSVAMIAKGQEVKFCCKDCVKEFHKDSAKYLKKLEVAGK
jgi:YHS domain-containing protein